MQLNYLVNFVNQVSGSVSVLSEKKCLDSVVGYTLFRGVNKITHWEQAHLSENERLNLFLFDFEHEEFRLSIKAKSQFSENSSLSYFFISFLHFLVAGHLQKQLDESRFELKRQTLFVHTISTISNTFLANLDIIKEMKGILGLTASFINASVGVIQLEFENKKVIECFGISKSSLMKLQLSKVPTSKELATSFTSAESIIIFPIVLGKHKIGCLFFVNKESRDGKEIFNALDKLLISTIGKQITISLKKQRYLDRQKELMNMMQSVIDSINASIIATDAHQKIILANKKTSELFNKTKSLVKSNIAEIFPKVSPLKNFVTQNMDSREPMISDSLLFSPADPKLVRANIAPLEARKYSGKVYSFEDVTELQKIKENFSKYATRELLDLILQNNYRTRLGGELIYATLFFSDIRGFTSLSEQNSVEEIVDTLNQYFNLMIGVVDLHGGYVDKLVGDEIMAVFKDSEGKEKGVNRAIRAGLDMKEKLEFFNTMRSEQGLFTLHFGAGINTGEVILGNIGSFNRMDYTVIGDNVNLAARLCSRAQSGQILVSERSVLEASVEFDFTFIEEFKAKGKEIAIKTFDVRLK